MMNWEHSKYRAAQGGNPLRLNTAYPLGEDDGSYTVNFPEHDPSDIDLYGWDFSDRGSALTANTRKDSGTSAVSRYNVLGFNYEQVAAAYMRVGALMFSVVRGFIVTDIGSLPNNAQDLPSIKPRPIQNQGITVDSGWEQIGSTNYLPYRDFSYVTDLNDKRYGVQFQAIFWKQWVPEWTYSGSPGSNPNYIAYFDVDYGSAWDDPNAEIQVYGVWSTVSPLPGANPLFNKPVISNVEQGNSYVGLGMDWPEVIDLMNSNSPTVPALLESASSNLFSLGNSIGLPDYTYDTDDAADVMYFPTPAINRTARAFGSRPTVMEVVNPRGFTEFGPYLGSNNIYKNFFLTRKVETATNCAHPDVMIPFTNEVSAADLNMPWMHITCSLTYDPDTAARQPTTAEAWTRIQNTGEIEVTIEGEGYEEESVLNIWLEEELDPFSAAAVQIINDNSYVAESPVGPVRETLLMTAKTVNRPDDQLRLDEALPFDALSAINDGIMNKTTYVYESNVEKIQAGFSIDTIDTDPSGPAAVVESTPTFVNLASGLIDGNQADLGFYTSYIQDIAEGRFENATLIGDPVDIADLPRLKMMVFSKTITLGESTPEYLLYHAKLNTSWDADNPEDRPGYNETGCSPYLSFNDVADTGTAELSIVVPCRMDRMLEGQMTFERGDSETIDSVLGDWFDFYIDTTWNTSADQPTAVYIGSLWFERLDSEIAASIGAPEFGAVITQKTYFMNTSSAGPVLCPKQQYKIYLPIVNGDYLITPINQEVTMTQGTDALSEVYNAGNANSDTRFVLANPISNAPAYFVFELGQDTECWHDSGIVEIDRLRDERVNLDIVYISSDYVRPSLDPFTCYIKTVKPASGQSSWLKITSSGQKTGWLDYQAVTLRTQKIQVEENWTTDLRDSLGAVQKVVSINDFGNVYPSGGLTIHPQDFGMKSIEFMSIQSMTAYQDSPSNPAVVASRAVANKYINAVTGEQYWKVHVFIPNPENGKFEELPDGTSLASPEDMRPAIMIVGI